MNSPLARKIVCEGDDTTFAGMIADGLKFWRRTTEPSNGSDVDNFSAALRNHDFTNCLRKEECAGQIRLNHFVPVFKLHLFDGSAPGCAGVVDQDVNFVELRNCRLHNRAHVVRVFDVAA